MPASTIDQVDIDLLIGQAVNDVLAQKGSFYILEIRQAVINRLPQQFQDQMYVVPWIAQQVEDALHRKVYAWVKGLTVTGRFKKDGAAIMHPKYGCMPDGKGNYLWFLVADATDDELAAWEGARERKIAKQVINLQAIQMLRERANGRRPREVIDYD